ncbi:MAG: UDP-N-acetylglucosamine 2-epimerase (non-hydrolyzing) [Patescibacteria group bacterium]|nr:UDP-N-acetylglucosamine 2-epimerase (non-hydrolyzing) [Patescibacteria group bacterium]
MKKTKKKICIVLGTRPEIIKLSPVIRETLLHSPDSFIIHTGQHYSQDMDAIFFEELELAEPKYNLGVGSGLHGEQTAKMLTQIEKILLDEKPDIVIVHGDTNSTLAGALTAVKLDIPIAHVEAGLRSYDRKMPEEVNRVLVDHISTWLFAPTDGAREQALQEGIASEKIKVVGNTIADALEQNIDIAKKRSTILKKFKLRSKNYILMTAHRPENTDVRKNLENIVNALVEITNKTNKYILWPVHPRTTAVLKKYGLDKVLNENKKILIKEPQGFMDFIILEANAALILTDSGGLQEEACILEIPCVTLRNNTERPESVEVGANVLVGANTDNIIKTVLQMLDNKRTWDSPYGDGKSAQHILDILLSARGGVK